MQKISIIGLDLAKQVFQVHAADAQGRCVLRFPGTIAAIDVQLAAIEKQLRAWHKTDAQSQRLDTIPGLGLIGATALSALVPDPSLFQNGRHLAA